LIKICTYYFQTHKTKKYIYKKSKRNLAPKKVYTRSHPDPEPAIVTDNPEQLLRKKTIVEGSVSHTPFHKSLSFSGEPVTFQNPDFDTFSQQSLIRTWSNSFVTGIIFDPTVLQPRTPEVLSPMDKPEVKKNPLQILSEYENIRINQGETVQDYCTRFNNLYNAIPTEIKPPQGLALIKFLNGFDADMSYQLRERNSTTLEDMQKSAISVEANLLAKRACQRSERRITIKEEPSTSTSDSKLDSLVREMERMMERLTVLERNPPRDNPPDP
jgi:hypothetical protein